MTHPADASHALYPLARHCGIADDYYDIWGHHHPTSDATRRALLAAMHLPLDTHDPATILRDLEDAEWRRLLPPVLVLRENEPVQIPLGVPAEQELQPWRWTLTLENGERHAGECTPAHLRPLGRRAVDGSEVLRCAFEYPGIAAPGYHHFDVETPDDARAEMSLIVTPPTCYQPEAIQDTGRVWGMAVQLYGVRSRHNWGIGDFTDLRQLVALTAAAGGGIVGTNPLHALFPDNPAHISPYSPSSRSALNPLYLDVEALPEFGECTAAQALVAQPAFQARLRTQRAATLIDTPAVAAAKREVLDLLWRHFREQHLTHDSTRAQDFHRFRAAAGAPLERLARFEALQAHFRASDTHIWGWPAWPVAYRDPDAPAVAEFAATHADAIDFHAWLQWCADAQLAAVGHQSWRSGLGVGLYADLAIGANPGGADCWSWQDVHAAGVHAGAPADDFNLHGQDWGLPPWVPHRLRDAAYAPFIEMLRANMKHAGALRIDHVMGLARIFWVPAGRPATEGAYVSYPLDDLLGIVALESRRNQCLVIGEDLGTVPEGFRCRLASADFLCYRPFLFERGADGGFKPPADYERGALVAASTHDLPTLAGLWQGSDLDTRTALDLFPTEALRERLIVERAQDRARLLVALEREGLLPAGTGVHPVAVPELTPSLVTALHAWLARTPAQVLVVQPEDMLGLAEQANLPGSRDDQHPNWRRRLTLDLEEWGDDPRFQQLGDALRRERGSAVTPHPDVPVEPRVAVIPRATYRLQFNKDFTLRAGRRPRALPR